MSRKDCAKRYYEKHKEEVRAKAKEFYYSNRAQILRKIKDKRSNPSLNKHELFKKREQRVKTKTQVLTHYSNGKLACRQCGESRLACLTIDHINGGGSKHKRELKKHGSIFYIWLRQNNFPVGYQVLCMNCQFVKRVMNREYFRDNGELEG